MTEPGDGKITARVYALELIGDHTLITCQVGEATLTVKADKSAHFEMDEPIGITFADASCLPVRYGYGRAHPPIE